MSDGRRLLPGATLGVFGGGQLGRMFAMAASRMGYRTIVFTPEVDSPAGQVAHETVVAAYEDEDAVRRFAGCCDGITLEFENVPVGAVELAAEVTVVRPGADVLRVAQDRLEERAFLDRHGLPCAAHAAVRSADELGAAVRRLGTPVVVKSARMGYDGRGQIRVNDVADVHSAWGALGVNAALCESWVHYQCEISVLVARSGDGAIEVFGPIENRHVHHILDLSFAPARVSETVAREALEIGRQIAASIALEGLICVELFVTPDGALLVNELAPRPHNSGHLTIEACAVSQFEQQVRALCNLPLGAMMLRSPAAMVNLLGDLWSEGIPDWCAVLKDPAVRVHLYGKDGARAGRKMGHLTVAAATVEAARTGAEGARRLLSGRRG